VFPFNFTNDHRKSGLYFCYVLAKTVQPRIHGWSVKKVTQDLPWLWQILGNL
jgi:hypothetical protein